MKENGKLAANDLVKTFLQISKLPNLAKDSQSKGKDESKHARTLGFGSSYWLRHGMLKELGPLNVNQMSKMQESQENFSKNMMASLTQLTSMISGNNTNQQQIGTVDQHVPPQRTQPHIDVECVMKP
ncbi:hypothetical protein L1887_27759 [Cichorium endivia]|nr:hypothetical protein L1887_27759 [Cichorium endivia]